MRHRFVLAACLLFSGLAALVYQILWTRLLGFAFGTTTEAIATVLGVFFGGMAIGNLLAARHLAKVERPLRIYAWLELAIGLFALATLPVLGELEGWYAHLVAGQGAFVTSAIRLVIASLVLLPPTMAMGATLPIVARGLVADDASIGRWSGYLYAANTFGAVAGVYLTGFWLLPGLGLTRTILVAVAVNLLVALFVLAVAGKVRVARRADQDDVSDSAGVPSDDAVARAPFLVFFAISGFVAIGYEIVWSRVFGIVMEGTIYGFSAVLSAYLLGIAFGSLVISFLVDRIRNLTRAFGLLHLAIAVSVALGMAVVPYLPLALRRLADWSGGGDAIHLLLVLVVPIVLLPTSLFGAAFPILIRIYTSTAERVGEGMGIATAANTAGSILASLAVGMWLIPAAGIDASLYLLLVCQLGVAVLILTRYQPGALPTRLGPVALAVGGSLGVALLFTGVHADRAITGRNVKADGVVSYASALSALEDTRVFLAEGKTSIVTIHDTHGARTLQTNGMPEAGLRLGPPYLARETVLLGLMPYLLAEDPRRALVIGLGGANTVDALTRTAVAEIEAVELEPRVVDAVRVLYEGRRSPLEDPRVDVRIGDGRHALLLGAQAEQERYDVIASQPSHPWLAGAANLFTEEFFGLARNNLSSGGIFALWVNGFRTDPESVLAILSSFERVFPGALLIDAGAARPRDSLILLGARQPIQMDLDRMRARFEEPDVRSLLDLYEIESIEQVLALSEGPTSAFAAIDPNASNTDDNAFVETRIPRRLDWSVIDFSEIEDQLAPDARVLAPSSRPIDVVAVAKALLRAPVSHGANARDRWPYAGKIERLLRVHGGTIPTIAREVLLADAELRSRATAASAVETLRELADRAPEQPESLRVLGLYLAREQRDFTRAADAFASAYQRSNDAQDAYDAGRALFYVDPQGAFSWFDRIPATERSRFSRLALYDALRAARSGERGAEIRPEYDELLRYYDTADGRSLSLTLDVLATVAEAVGDRDATLRFGDLAREKRRSAGAAALARAQSLFAEGKISEASSALKEGRKLLPADPGIVDLAVRIAHAEGDATAVASGLAVLRGLAPSLNSAIEAENRLRAALGLPLLPDDAAVALFSRQEDRIALQEQGSPVR